MPRHSTRPKNAPPREVVEVATMRADQRERRDRVIAATMRLMVDVDYDEIQIRDVADESGVALGTLYRYFVSKEHIFACALLEWATVAPAGIASADLPTVERVKTVFQKAARAFERQPRVYDVVMRLHSSREPEVAALWGEFATLQSEALADALGDVPSPQREDIVSVMGAVLSEAVRSRRLGVISEQEVERRLDRAAELILGATRS